MFLLSIDLKQRQDAVLKVLTFSLIIVAGIEVLATDTPSATAENSVLHFSYELEHLLDVDKNPCQDFYGYVCARSLNNTKLWREQNKKQEQQRFEKFLKEDNNEQLLDVELKLKNFYKSCKYSRGNLALNSTPLYLSTGFWPAIEPTTTTSTTTINRRRRSVPWLTLLANFHELGVMYFFESRIEIKSNKRVIQLQPNTAMPNTLAKYEQLLEQILHEYLVDAARGPLVALETLNFERNRREIAKTDIIDDIVEFSYENFKSAAVFGSAVQLDWDAYFRKLLGKPLRPFDVVKVRQLPKLVQYFELLRNTTAQRLLNWLWIDYLMDKTSNDCEQLLQKYLFPVYEQIVQRVDSDKPQMAQIYAEIGNAYDALLPQSTWIDEMSAQNSKQFLGRIIHWTLNGATTLDAAAVMQQQIDALHIDTNNFYLNVENLQRFDAQRKKQQRLSVLNPSNQQANEYLQHFRNLNALLQQQKLTTPLNYLLVAQSFAEHMIAAGSSSSITGAWRSMDSERDFVAFENCTKRRRQHAMSYRFNNNDLLLRLLGQRQALHAYEQWLERNAALQQRLDALLAAGHLQLSLKRLYFVGSVLSTCRLQQSGFSQRQWQRELLHSELRNTPRFTQVFNCRPDDELYSNARSICKVL